MIEIDPRIEQAFAEVLAKSRHRAADVTDRLAAKQRELAARSEQIREEGRRLSEELDRRVAARQENARNPWQQRSAKPTVLDFGGDDEEQARTAPTKPIPVQSPPGAAIPVAPPPASPPPPPARPEPQPRERVMSFEFETDDEPRPAPPRRRPRPAPADEDDDLSGRSWMR